MLVICMQKSLACINVRSLNTKVIIVSNQTSLCFFYAYSIYTKVEDMPKEASASIQLACKRNKKVMTETRGKY